MELEEIKRLYNAMNENGMSELSLKIGSDEKIRLKLNDLNTMRISEQQIKPEEENEDVPRSGFKGRRPFLGQIFSSQRL